MVFVWISKSLVLVALLLGPCARQGTLGPGGLSLKWSKVPFMVKNIWRADGILSIVETACRTCGISSNLLRMNVGSWMQTCLLPATTPKGILGLSGLRLNGGKGGIYSGQRQSNLS